MENLTLGQVGGALAYIVAFIGAIEFLAFRMRVFIKKAIKEETDPIKKDLNINTLNTLKNTMCNECMPLSERLEAGKLYIEKGGNGGGKIYFHELEKLATEKIQKGEKL